MRMTHVPFVLILGASCAPLSAGDHTFRAPKLLTGYSTGIDPSQVKFTKAFAQLHAPDLRLGFYRWFSSDKPADEWIDGLQPLNFITMTEVFGNGRTTCIPAVQLFRLDDWVEINSQNASCRLARYSYSLDPSRPAVDELLGKFEVLYVAAKPMLADPERSFVKQMSEVRLTFHLVALDQLAENSVGDFTDYVRHFTGVFWVFVRARSDPWFATDSYFSFAAFFVSSPWPFSSAAEYNETPELNCSSTAARTPFNPPRCRYSREPMLERMPE